MAKKKSSKTSAIEEVLINAVEVQLAVFNAGIEFWSQWVKDASKLKNSLEKGLQDFKSHPDDVKAVFMQVTEASTRHLRGIVELPKHFKTSFIDEIDKLKKTRKTSKSNGRAKRKPKRAVRAKN